MCLWLKESANTLFWSKLYVITKTFLTEKMAIDRFVSHLNQNYFFHKTLHKNEKMLKKYFHIFSFTNLEKEVCIRK